MLLLSIVDKLNIILLFVESDALRISASPKQFAEIPASILRFCGRLGGIEA